MEILIYFPVFGVVVLLVFLWSRIYQKKETKKFSEAFDELKNELGIRNPCREELLGFGQRACAHIRFNRSVEVRIGDPVLKAMSDNLVFYLFKCYWAYSDLAVGFYVENLDIGLGNIEVTSVFTAVEKRQCLLVKNDEEKLLDGYLMRALCRENGERLLRRTQVIKEIAQFKPTHLEFFDDGFFGCFVLENKNVLSKTIKESFLFVESMCSKFMKTV